MTIALPLSDMQHTLRTTASYFAVAGIIIVLIGGWTGRVLVRPSGTEPLIRVMAEGSDQKQLEEVCTAIADVVKREQGEA